LPLSSLAGHSTAVLPTGVSGCIHSKCKRDSICKRFEIAGKSSFLTCVRLSGSGFRRSRPVFRHLKVVAGPNLTSTKLMDQDRRYSLEVAKHDSILLSVTVRVIAGSLRA
jgi:hypothetical protein